MNPFALSADQILFPFKLINSRKAIRKMSKIGSPDILAWILKPVDPLDSNRFLLYLDVRGTHNYMLIETISFFVQNKYGILLIMHETKKFSGSYKGFNRQKLPRVYSFAEIDLTLRILPRISIKWINVLWKRSRDIYRISKRSSLCPSKTPCLRKCLL